MFVRGTGTGRLETMLRRLRRRRDTGCGLVLLLLLAAAQPSWAQFSAAADRPSDLEWHYDATASFERQWEADVDGGPKFDYTQGRVGATFMGPMGANLLLGVTGAYSFTEYGFRANIKTTNTSSLYSNHGLQKDPWGGVNTVESAILGTWLIDDRFSIVGAVPIRYSAEVGADQNGVTAGFIGGIRYALQDRLAITLGVGVMSEIEDSERVFPVLGLDYRVNDAVSIRTQGSYTEGGDLGVYWGPSQHVELSLSVGYDRRRFRLDRHGGPGADRNGVGEFRAVPIMAGIRIDMYEGVIASVEVGGAFAGQLRVENSDGRELYEQNYDPAPRLAVSVKIPF